MLPAFSGTPPAHFKPEFERLRNELHKLQSVWLDFQYLFIGETAPVVTLDRAANFFFFFTVQESMLHYVVQGLCRLTDDAKGRRRLGFDYLVRDLRKFDSPLATKLERDLKAFDAAYQPIRDFRDRRISHLDNDTAMGRVQLPPTTGTLISGALDHAANIIDEIGGRHLDTSYARHPIAVGTAQNMVTHLKRGLDYFDHEWAERRKSLITSSTTD